MMIRSAVLCTGALLGAIALAGTSAQALTMKECSAKYKAAKDGNTLNGMKWNDFRKAECGSDTTAAPASSTTAAPAASVAPAPKAQPASVARPIPAPKAVTTSAPASAPSNAVFPASVSTKYSSEAAGKARMHTCRDQYDANKASNANGGMKWTEKGGGYYSECNKHLKG